MRRESFGGVAGNIMNLGEFDSFFLDCWRRRDCGAAGEMGCVQVVIKGSSKTTGEKGKKESNREENELESILNLICIAECQA